jgi:putative salt-induced outer membrane protein YdiY
MNRRSLCLSIALTAVLLATPCAWADTLALTANDRPADVTESEFISYAPQNPLIGLDTAIAAASEKGESLWKGKLELGAFFTDGNTDRLGGNFGLTVTRDDEDTKFTGKATATYAEENDERTTNEQFVSLREDFKLGEWYAFAILSFERDEFERIDLRAIFAPGAGRTLADDPDFKLDVELGPTLTYTNYENDSGDGIPDEDAEYAIEARIAFHAEIAVFDSAKIIQDLEIFPSLSDFGQYRFVSETAFVQPLSEAWYFKLSIIDKYNSDPVSGTEKNDLEVRVSLVFDF